MTWTYSDPSGSDNDAVRFLVGDTDTSDQLVSDEEIAFALTEEGSTRLAAAAICEAIAAKFSREVDQNIGGALAKSKSQRAEAYAKRAKELRSRASRLVTPFAGGLTVSGKQTLEQDTDRVQPAFRIGVHDYE